MSNHEHQAQINIQCFSIIVDGEVATNYCFDEQNEKMIAIMSSNPIIVPNPEMVPPGWMWDGEKFYNPFGDTQ